MAPPGSIEDPEFSEDPLPLVSVPVIAGVGAGFIVGLATVVSILVKCHCSTTRPAMVKGSPKPNSAGMSSKESLISLHEANAYQPTRKGLYF